MENNTIEFNGQKWTLLPHSIHDDNHLFYKGNWYRLVEEEKEWEILSLGCSKLQYFFQNGDWVTIMGKASTWFPYEKGLEVLPIYSVKRKDGEIFTVGEKYIDHLGRERDLLGFKVNGDVIMVWTQQITTWSNKNPIVYTDYLVSIQKRKPLFTTQDGKDVYEGDTIFCAYNYANEWALITEKGTQVTKNYVRPCSFLTDFSTKEAALAWIEAQKPKPLFITHDGVEFWNKEDRVYSLNPHVSWDTSVHSAGFLKNGGYKKWLHFSTPEAREQYVLQNRPLLSLNDLLNAWGGCDAIPKEKEHYASSPLFQLFTQSAQQKLNP